MPITQKVDINITGTKTSMLSVKYKHTYYSMFFLITKSPWAPGVGSAYTRQLFHGIISEDFFEIFKVISTLFHLQKHLNWLI